MGTLLPLRQASAHLEAVEAGHEHVENEGVRLPAPHVLQGLLPVLGQVYVVALEREARLSDSRTARSSSTTRIFIAAIVRDGSMKGLRSG